MSKLAVIRQYQYSPAAGGPLSFITKGIGKLLPKIFPSLKRGAQQVATLAKTPLGTAVATGGAYAMTEQAIGLLKGGGGGGGAGASGVWRRRRSRGITARELRGYRKVANLLHKEGMVSRRARGHK